jgi:hypothetical protein
VSFKRIEPNFSPISINESQIDSWFNESQIIDSWFNNHKGLEMERSRGKNSQKGIPANLPIETAQKVWT